MKSIRLLLTVLIIASTIGLVPSVAQAASHSTATAAAPTVPVLTITAPVWVERGKTARLAGSIYVVRGGHNVPVTGIRLLLQKRTGLIWSSLAYVTTSSTGAVALNTRPLADTAYRWMYRGDAKVGAGASKTLIVRSLVLTKYTNCAALNVVYPHGVARTATARDSSPAPVDPSLFYVTSVIYDLNAGLDHDKDGIACEKA